MSDEPTPRTDAAWKQCSHRDFSDISMVMHQHARELEREVARLTAECARLQRQFQLETLRTFKQGQLLVRFAEVYSADHYAEPWAKACTRCDLLRETKALLEEPINSPGSLAALAACPPETPPCNPTLTVCPRCNNEWGKCPLLGGGSP